MILKSRAIAMPKIIINKKFIKHKIRVNKNIYKNLQTFENTFDHCWTFIHKACVNLK